MGPLPPPEHCLFKPTIEWKLIRESVGTQAYTAQQRLFLTKKPSAMPGSVSALLRVNGIEPVQNDSQKNYFLNGSVKKKDSKIYLKTSSALTN